MPCGRRLKHAASRSDPCGCHVLAWHPIADGSRCVLRDFFRNHVFERFPLFSGICLGVAQAFLLAWGLALHEGGLAAVPFGWLMLVLVVLALANGWLLPRLGLTQPASYSLALLERAYLAIGFGTIVIAGVIGAFALVFVLGIPLLAFAGVSDTAAFTLFRTGSVAFVAIATAALCHGVWIAPRRLEVTQIRVAIPGLDLKLRGLRIAHLSDLHIGNGLEGARLAGIVDRTNAIEADLVVLTGDLFDHDPRFLDAGAAALARLRARLGVFAVLGNHDWMTGTEAVAAALAPHAPRVVLLRDAWAKLFTDAPLYVAGAEDPGRDWTENGQGLPAIDALAAEMPVDGPRILLVHRPDAFPQATQRGFALTLSGHFHGGQIAFPFAGGRWNVARALTPFPRGAYRMQDAHLYVSRGLGFAGPRIRFGSDPEITVLELA